jgi:hypothetical protein
LVKVPPEARSTGSEPKPSQSKLRLRSEVSSGWCKCNIYSRTEYLLVVPDWLIAHKKRPEWFETRTEFAHVLALSFAT